MTLSSSANEPSATLGKEELANMDAYWRASKYLALGMIYLLDNPLLKQPLKPQHIKNRLLGHWGSSPGLAFIYVHLNRLIRKYDLNMIYLAGPGHGAPGVLAPVYLEGTYSERYPEKSEDEVGMREFFKQFSFPGGIGSHCTPETSGSIHEGGELGYVLSHACGAAFDNPDLIVAAVVGDGEAEPGHWRLHGISANSSNPIRDGAVLPFLHLNGYKINNPTLLARITHGELENCSGGMDGRLSLWKAQTPRPCMRRWQPPSNGASWISKRFRRNAETRVFQGACGGPWSCFVHRKVGARRQRWTGTGSKARGAPIRCRCRKSKRIRHICACSRNGCGQ